MAVRKSGLRSLKSITTTIKDTTVQMLIVAEPAVIPL